MLTTATRFDSIDDCLGPRAERFFGEGFRRVGHHISGVVVCPAEDGTGNIGATAELNYPGDWSTKSAGAIRPHVSGIDALVISVQLAEIYLARAYGLDRPQRRRMWVRRFTMRAPGAPTEELGGVPVKATQTASWAEPNSLCGHVSRFSCTVGTLKTECEIEHEIPAVRIATSTDFGRSGDDILGRAEGRYFGAGYKRRQHTITDVEGDADHQYIQGLVRVTPIGLAGLEDDGLGGDYCPSLSMVDCFLSLAQFAQVLVYQNDGIDRGESNTLWLRTVTMSCRTPYQPMTNSFTASLALTRTRSVRLRAGTWRTFGVSGHFQGIHAEASIAHQLPPAQAVRVSA